MGRTTANAHAGPCLPAEGCTGVYAGSCTVSWDVVAAWTRTLLLNFEIRARPPRRTLSALGAEHLRVFQNREQCLCSYCVSVAISGMECTGKPVHPCAGKPGSA